MRVHKPKNKSARWARAWPAAVQLPGDCCAGDLVEVLEALHVCQATVLHFQCSMRGEHFLKISLLRESCMERHISKQQFCLLVWKQRQPLVQP